MDVMDVRLPGSIAHGECAAPLKRGILGEETGNGKAYFLDVGS